MMRMPQTSCIECGRPWIGEIRIWAAEFRPSGKRRVVYKIVERIRFCQEHSAKYLAEAGRYVPYILAREGLDWLLKKFSISLPKLPMKIDVRWRKRT